MFEYNRNRTIAGFHAQAAEERLYKASATTLDAVQRLTFDDLLDIDARVMAQLADRHGNVR